MKRLRSYLIVGIIVIPVTVVIVASYWFQWGWTGFIRKTLWDWLQLLSALAIPVVAGFSVAWYTTKQTQAKEFAAEQQRKIDLEKAEQQHKSELEKAEQRHKTEIEIATDNQREALLQAYIDKMSELLIEKNLVQLAEKESTGNNIARVRTLTVLSRLDSIRKAIVLQFLSEAWLIDKDSPIVDLRGADLSHVDFSKLYNDDNLDPISPYGPYHLYRVNLSGANLSYANLVGVDLSRAKLGGADLRYANLSRTILSNADFGSANLHCANLRDADLVGNPYEDTGANLMGADLSDADLRGTGPDEINIDDEVFDNMSNVMGAYSVAADIDTTLNKLLDHAKSLKGAIMPDGSKHL